MTQNRQQNLPAEQAGSEHRHQTKNKNRLGSGLCDLGSVSIHGGNIYEAAQELGIPENEIIDFSASINPLGISDNVKDVIKNDLDSLVHYPDPDTKLLRQFLAEHHGIDTNSIICGNGSTELIYLLPRALKPEKVLITAPTFSEYERSVRIQNLPTGQAGTEHRTQIRCLDLQEEDNFKVDPDEFIKSMIGEEKSLCSDICALGSVNMAFLCNPNNPTGSTLSTDEVMEIANAARKIKCFLIIDEAFIDFVPEYSVINEVVGNPYLIVLRSMTKFYALTGLRIGYGVIPEHLTEVILKYKEPWTVNSLAQKAALAVLRDNDYNDRTVKLIREEKIFLENGFTDIGIDFIPSAVNYYSLKIKETKMVCNKLKTKGILIRDCSNFQGLDDSYIRVAVKSRSDNEKLLKELSSLCRK